MPWWLAACANRSACGVAVTTLPSARAPFTHHWRRRLRLVWSKSVRGGRIVVIITTITLRQPSADMANCITCSPLIRLLTLHPNTMGDAPYVQFGRNRLWVRVIVGYLPKQIKSIFLHTTINWAAADCFACGAATPNLRAGASSQHLGRLPLALVWSESIAGASN